jgi:hypothetical protein
MSSRCSVIQVVKYGCWDSVLGGSMSSSAGRLWRIESLYWAWVMAFMSSMRCSTALRRAVAACGCCTGSYIVGEAIIPASSAASWGATSMASRAFGSCGSGATGGV